MNTVYSGLNAQEKKDTAKLKAPAFNGLIIESDAVPIAETLYSGGKYYGAAATLKANFSNNFFPALEIGFGGANKTLEVGSNFKADGIYEKVGIDFSIAKSKLNKQKLFNYALFGLRLGMSNFEYNYNNLTIAGNYWEENQNTISSGSIHATKLWYEFSGGLRVNIYKNLSMGWTARNAHLLGNNNGTYPWYIPGYGKNSTSHWNFSYVIGYTFK